MIAEEHFSLFHYVAQRCPLENIVYIHKVFSVGHCYKEPLHSTQRRQTNKKWKRGSETWGDDDSQFDNGRIGGQGSSPMSCLKEENMWFSLTFCVKDISGGKCHWERSKSVRNVYWVILSLWNIHKLLKISVNSI